MLPPLNSSLHNNIVNYLNLIPERVKCIFLIADFVHLAFGYSHSLKMTLGRKKVSPSYALFPHVHYEK